jgi:hypothetical protein
MGSRAITLVVLLAALALLVAATPGGAASKSRQLRWIHVDHIGEKGNGPGKFPAKTGGIAVDQDCGDVFIADPEQKRIHRFSKNGRHIASFGDTSGVGRIDDPHGIEIKQTFGGRVNFDGPPPTCGILTTLSPSLMVTDWGKSQETPGRISFFGLDGSFNSAWCETPADGCAHVGTVVPSGRQTRDGIDPFPNDVDAKGERIWIAGAYGGRVREYTFEPKFVRQTTEGANYPTGPSSLSVGDAPAYIWATDDSQSQLTLLDLNPVNEDINRITTLGGGEYDSRTPGKFGRPNAVEVGPAGRFFDDIFVLDGERIQVFTPGGDNGALITQPELRHVINLPGEQYGGNYIDVRYDGTIYVTGRYSEGADVYSPGPIVTLRVKARSNRRIELSGRVFPPHARRRIRLERLEQGWETITRVRLDQGSRFKHVWRAPRAGASYALRAVFSDPHPYHANRNSEIKEIRAKD